jgi:hypothetical protein
VIAQRLEALGITLPPVLAELPFDIAVEVELTARLRTG